jgi:hypothetical protein
VKVKMKVGVKDMSLYLFTMTVCEVRKLRFSSQLACKAAVSLRCLSTGSARLIEDTRSPVNHVSIDESCSGPWHSRLLRGLCMSWKHVTQTSRISW